MNFISEHYEWIFSGIGLPIVAFLYNYFFKNETTLKTIYITNTISKEIHYGKKKEKSSISEYLNSQKHILEEDSRFKIKNDILTVYREKLLMRILTFITNIIIISFFIGIGFYHISPFKIFTDFEIIHLFYILCYLWFINFVVTSPHRRIEINLKSGELNFLPNGEARNVKQIKSSKFYDAIFRTPSLLYFNFGDHYGEYILSFNTDTEYKLLKSFFTELIDRI